MLLAAALLVVTGCKKDNNTENNNGEKMIFTATINNGAKTQISGYDQVWNTGDEVNINGGKFTVTPKAGNESWATFEGQTVTADEGGMYKAIFPNSYYVSEDLYNFPATQTYNGNNLSGVNPLYAESTTQELVFHNICALMKLTLRGNDTDEVTEIKVSADQALSGYFEVKERAEGYFAELVTSEGSADVTLMCGDGVALTAEGTTFYIAIPEYDDYSNLTFTATTSEGKTWTYKANGGNNIAILANNLYESTQTPEFVSPAPTAPEGAISGLFSVSADKQVYFSQGNLYYDGSKFQFEANQYNTPSSWSTDHISHFYWSKDANKARAQSYNDEDASGSDEFFTNVDGFKVNVGQAEQTGWRTLSKDEWTHLLNLRTMTYDKPRYTNKTAGIVIGSTTYNGIFIYPDDYNGNEVGSGGPSNWADIKNAGIVFLPAAGYRDNSSISDVAVRGVYWSSTTDFKTSAYQMSFNSSRLNTSKDARKVGGAVRLVTDAK